MKRLRLLAFLPVVALIWIAIAEAQMIPQRAKCVSAQGSAAASVACAVPTPALGLGLNGLTAFTVMCQEASGSTSQAAVTITGLSGSGTMTLYLQESQTSPTFVAEDFTYPVVEAAPSSVPTPISVNMPAVTNGGVCSCAACYVQY
jgi:hypothetical protein